LKQVYNMVLLQKKSFLEGLNALGSSWVFIGMHGTMPTEEPKESLLELAKQGVCMFESLSEIRNDNHLKFINVGNIVPYVGTSSISSEFGYLNTTFDIEFDFEDGKSFIDFMSNQDTIRLEENESLTYRLKQPTDIQLLQLDSSSVLKNFEVEIEVEGVWETVDSITANTYRKNYEMDKSVTAFRLRNTYVHVQTVENCLSAYSPSAQNDSVLQTIEWCLMVPKNQDSINGVVPFGWIDCSGPNDGASCIINNANPNAGEDVRLLYLTLQPAVLEF